jgi:hypothetical protein
LATLGFEDFDKKNMRQYNKDGVFSLHVDHQELATQCAGKYTKEDRASQIASLGQAISHNNSAEIEKVLNEAETSLIYYETLEFPDYRKILFFRDLFTYLSMSSNQILFKRLTELLKLTSHAKPNLIPGILRLGWEKQLRNR